MKEVPHLSLTTWLRLAFGAPVEWQRKFVEHVRLRIESGVPEELAELQTYSAMRGDRHLGTIPE